MGIKKTARSIGVLRDSPLDMPAVGETVHIMVDCGQSPRWTGLHRVGETWKSCKAGEAHDRRCVYCERGDELRERWTLSVDLSSDADGVMVPRTMWLSARDLARIADVVPESGSVWLDVGRIVDESGDLRDDGTAWEHTTFSLGGE